MPCLHDATRLQVNKSFSQPAAGDFLLLHLSGEAWICFSIEYSQDEKYFGDCEEENGEVSFLWRPVLTTFLTRGNFLEWEREFLTAASFNHFKKLSKLLSPRGNFLQ